MPAVDVLSDMDGFFTHVRAMLPSDNTTATIREAGLERLVRDGLRGIGSARGQLQVAVITPGRMICLAPAPLPKTKLDDPDQLAYTAKLPLQCHKVRAAVVVESGGKTREIIFLLRLSATSDRRPALDIQLH